MIRRGFTIVELTVVIALIAVLAAILFPVFARAREKARQASCTANLFNIGMALRLYAHDNDGRFPPGLHNLQPLWPRYMAVEQSFKCPSVAGSGGTMGWQPPPQLLAQPGSGFAPGVPPGGPPGGYPGGPGGPGAPSPGPTGWGSNPPPGPQALGPGGLGAPPGAGPPAGGKGAVPPSPPGRGVGGEGAGGATLMSSYYYHPALRYNVGTLLPLVADSAPRHNDRANVLFTDGSLRSVTAATWLEHWRPLYDSGAGCRRSRQGPRAGGDNHS